MASKTFKMVAGVPEAEWKKREAPPVAKPAERPVLMVVATNDNSPKYIPGNYRAQPGNHFERFRALRARARG
jgi:hypothetical protein